MDKYSSYSVAQAVTPINWLERLRENPEEVSRDELYQWRKDASNWVTCACGNQCVMIPRNELGEPLDEKLSDLGVDFYKEIATVYHHKINNLPMSFENALNILSQIEQRSKELIEIIINTQK